MRHSPPPFLRNPGNMSMLGRHNQSKIHNRRNHSAGGKRMRNKTAAVRSHVDGRLLLNRVVKCEVWVCLFPFIVFYM